MTGWPGEACAEFRARYREQGQSGVLHEHSRFVRLDRQWVYLGPIGAA
jgi:uncharacterized protein YchJ